MVVVGAFTCILFAILLGALFGIVGFIVGCGVGLPAFLAWFYYRIDLKSRDAKNGDD
jgi:hypothetical protein